MAIFLQESTSAWYTDSTENVDILKCDVILAGERYACSLTFEYFSCYKSHAFTATYVRYPGV